MICERLHLRGIEMGKYLTELALKRIARVVFEEIVKPAAKEYVASTQNKYDDLAVEFLNDFVEDLLAEKPKAA